MEKNLTKTKLLQVLSEVNSKNLELVEDLKISNQVREELSKKIAEKNTEIEVLSEDKKQLASVISRIGTFVFADHRWLEENSYEMLVEATKRSVFDNVNFLGQVQALNSIISGMIVALKVGDNSRLQEKKVL